ncbi:MAG: hypothetical protein HY809_08845 [Nitrospirae bacterium]|nr:hypothetical protein [Nitrospirota bacterium]
MKKRNKAKLAAALLTLILIFMSWPSFADDPDTAVETGRNDAKIAFNFVDVDMPTIIKFISKITGFNFIFDEKIKGTITIVAPTRLTVEESFTLFTSVLNMKGFTIMPAGSKTYTIIPSVNAKESGEIPGGQEMPVNDRFITKILTLQHIDANEALKFLRPVVSKEGLLSFFGPRNLLLIVDSASNVEKVSGILSKIDQPPTHNEPSKIHVYFVEHADATELAQVLEGIIRSTRAASQTTPKDPQDTLSESVSRISITPDKATNSLVIVAPPSDFNNILDVIKSLDKRKKQVYVEAMIIEASIDKLKDIGAKWRAVARHNGEPIVIGGVGNLSSETVLSIIDGLSGFSAGGMGNFLTIPGSTVGSDSENITVPGFAAIFSLSDFQNAVDILSTPQILTSDHEEAEIVVGENVPFISKREGNADTVASTYSTNIDRKDVGISLKITPQITEGDYVNLDIYQEISSVKKTSETIFTTVGPTTTKRSTKTSIVVKDSQTVVISGLMQEKDEEGIGKTPLLGDIPLLGWFFKYKTTTKTKTNLLLFLTPHIIKDSSQLSDITGIKHRAFSMEERQFPEDELLVRFRDDVSEETAQEIITGHGAAILTVIKELKIYHIKLRKKLKVEDAIAEFSPHPEVLYAEPNFRLNIQQSPGEKNPVISPQSSGTEDDKYMHLGPYNTGLGSLDVR